MLMTIQLPDDLVVTDCRIEVSDLGPTHARRAATVDRIGMPIGKLQAAVAKQVVVAREDPIRTRGRVGSSTWPSRQDLVTHRSRELRIDHATRFALGEPFEDRIRDTRIAR